MPLPIKIKLSKQITTSDPFDKKVKLETIKSIMNDNKEWGNFALYQESSSETGDPLLVIVVHKPKNPNILKELKMGTETPVEEGKK